MNAPASRPPARFAPPRAGGVSWWAALVAFMLWAVLGTGGAWLILQGWPAVPQVSAGAVASNDDRVGAAALTTLLQAPASDKGTEAPAFDTSPAAMAVKVLGAVANEAGQGAVLLQVGQAPARPYAPGAEVKGLGVVQAVTSSEVRLGATADGPTLTRLPMPKQPALKTTP